MTRTFQWKQGDIRVLGIPCVKRGPAMTGRLTDRIWKQAVSWDRFQDITAYRRYLYNRVLNNPGGLKPAPAVTPAVPQTRVLLCHDGRFLYAGFICRDPDLKSLLMRDRAYSHKVDQEDCVYVWLDPDLSHQRPGECEYIVNAAGQKSECLRGIYSGDYISLMAWEACAGVSGGHWTAEMMMPLDRVHIDGRCGQVFGLNVGRGYRGGVRLHVLMKPDGYYNCGSGYGVLLDGAGRGFARGVARVRRHERELERRRSGRALNTHPGSPAELGRHRDTNAMVGISVWGPDHTPVINVGRSDCYDRRWFGHDEPVITRRDVIEAALSGDPARLNGLRNRRVNQLYGAYCNFPTPKPVGQIILHLPGGVQRNWITDVKQGEDGEIRLNARCRQGCVTLRIYVHKRLNVIVVEGGQERLTGQRMAIRLYRHNDNPVFAKQPGYDYEADEKAGLNTGPLSPPVVGREGSLAWLRQSFPAELTFPKGFEVMLAGTVENAGNMRMQLDRQKTGLGIEAKNPYEGWVDPATNQQWATTHFRRQQATPGSAVTLQFVLSRPTFRAVFPVVSTQDGRDVTKAAVAVVSRIRNRPAETLFAESRSATVTERTGGYHFKQDLLMSQVFTAKFCAQDVVPWHGDLHFNELGGSFLFDFPILGRTREFESYFQMVEANLPAAGTLAKKAFGCRGAAWGVASFPIRFRCLPMTSLDWDYSIECTGLVVQPFWMTYLFTQDRRFLKERCYPVIREAARFYSDYVSLGKDGRYHIWPCTSSEHVTLQPYLKYNRDSNAALSMTRFILRACIEASKILGVDEQPARRWQAIVDRLAPYPMEYTAEGPRFVDVDGAKLMTEYNIFQPLFSVFYGNEIGLASSPQTIAMARRTLAGIRRLSTGHWGHIYRTMIRLGLYPGDPIGCEHLIQSHQGPIFLFPAVLERYTGEFRNYHARGAFRISAAMRRGRLIRVSVRSLAGGLCTMDLSRFPKLPEVQRADGSAETPVKIQGRRYLCFNTQAGADYAFRF